MVSGKMQFFVLVLLLAACAVASASEFGVSSGRKLSQDAGAETFFHPSGKIPDWHDAVEKAIFGFNKANADAAASATQGRRLDEGTGSAETYFHGTAPKPSMSDIHQAIFGFNQQGSGRKLHQAKDETFWPKFHGTAPKPSLGQIHKAIFGFNADGSKLMPEAFAPAPSATAGRRLLQDTHDETFFHGTAPKPSLGDVHKAIFGFNDANSETFHGTFPKPSMSDVHKAIFGFNADLSAKAPAPVMGGRKLLQAHDETFWPKFHGTAPKPSLGQIHKAIFGFNADGSKLMPEAFAPAPAATAGRHLLQDAHDETFFHGTAPKPSFGDVHQAIFGFNNDPASSETFHGTFPKPSLSDIHQAIFGFNSQSEVAPKALSAKAPAPKH
ncbi:hypothetical protein WJX81_008262 [Elliptochloris bilobata]|uniref:Ascorbate peroxidase n=1 Tax=Elliptochloris bilobata TaxID=381761 RepID=A0AAW1RTH4_9CHLO